MSQTDWPEVTQELYNDILAQWVVKPSVSHVVYETGLPRKLVSQIVTEGIPALDLAPLPPPKAKTRVPKKVTKSKRSRKKKGDDSNSGSDIASAAATAIAMEDADQRVDQLKGMLATLEDESATAEAKAKVMDAIQKLDGTQTALVTAKAKLKAQHARLALLDEQAIVGDNVRKSAEEAAAARHALRNTLNLGAIFSHITDKILEGILNNEIEIPQYLDPKVLAQLTSSVDKMTSAMERAIKIDKGRAGEPEKMLGVQIGVLIEGCTVEELDEMIETGFLPARLRKLVPEERSATVKEVIDMPTD